MNKKHSNLRVFITFLFLSLFFIISILLFSLNERKAMERVETTIHQKDNITIDVNLEISRTPRDIARGLMGRTKLSQNSGMLFVFDYKRDTDNGFWMYQTLIPLDIAFLDKEGKILSIHQMKPCRSKEFEECPSTYPDYPYYYALEMNKDFFSENNLSEGDYLEIDFLKTK